ncbi:MAG: response regulator [Candidatus Binatia bacterium]
MNVNNSPTPARSLLLVDHHYSFVHAVSNVLSGDQRISGLVWAHYGDDAIEYANKEAPDLVLVDEVLPDGKGIEVGRAIKRVASASRVMLMTVYDAQVYRENTWAAGLDGVIDKCKFAEELAALLDSLP